MSLFRWRKIHFWSSLVLFIPFVLWTISGIGLALVNPDKMMGEKKPSPPIDLQLLSVVPHETEPVRRIRIVSYGKAKIPAYRIDFIDGRILVTDGRTGLPPITAAEAREIAEADFGGDVTSVEPVTEKYQMGFDYAGEVPAFRINFSNARTYVSASTGEIIARRDIYKTAFDLCWMLHTFKFTPPYKHGDGTRLLQILGILSTVVTISGIVLYAPYIRVWRARSKNRSPAGP